MTKHSGGLPGKRIRSYELVAHSVNTKINKCKAYKTINYQSVLLQAMLKAPVCHCIIEPNEWLSTLRYSTWTFPRLRQFSNLVIRSPAQRSRNTLSVRATQAIHDEPARVIKALLSVCLSV